MPKSEPATNGDRMVHSTQPCRLVRHPTLIVFLKRKSPRQTNEHKAIRCLVRKEKLLQSAMLLVRRCRGPADGFKTGSREHGLPERRLVPISCACQGREDPGVGEGHTNIRRQKLFARCGEGKFYRTRSEKRPHDSKWRKLQINQMTLSKLQLLLHFYPT